MWEISVFSAQAGLKQHFDTMWQANFSADWRRHNSSSKTVEVIVAVTRRSNKVVNTPVFSDLFHGCFTSFSVLGLSVRVEKREKWAESKGVLNMLAPGPKPWVTRKTLTLDWPPYTRWFMTCFISRNKWPLSLHSFILFSYQALLIQNSSIIWGGISPLHVTTKHFNICN